MRYQIAPLFCRPWTINGVTPKLIESHYENNYGAAFNRLNEIAAELEALDLAKASPHAIHRLKQEEMAALNAVLLHELYFASLGGDGAPCPSPWRRRSRATSARSIAGARSSSRSAMRSPAARAGSCSHSCRAPAA